MTLTMMEMLTLMEIPRQLIDVIIMILLAELKRRSGGIRKNNKRRPRKNPELDAKVKAIEVEVPTVKVNDIAIGLMEMLDKVLHNATKKKDKGEEGGDGDGGLVLVV